MNNTELFQSSGIFFVSFRGKKKTAWHLIITISGAQLCVAGGYVDTQCPGSSRTAHTPQIKQHSLSVKRLAPKTAKPEENEPPHDPRCG